MLIESFLKFSSSDDCTVRTDEYEVVMARKSEKSCCVIYPSPRVLTETLSFVFFKHLFPFVIVNRLKLMLRF